MTPSNPTKNVPENWTLEEKQKVAQNIILDTVLSLLEE